MAPRTFNILEPVYARDEASGESVPCRPNETCAMCDGFYLKANGELPCWCGPGEALILDRVDTEILEREDLDLANLEAFRLIRRAFAEGRYPYPDFCTKCADRRIGTAALPVSDLRSSLGTIHLEASWLCNLDCPLCVPKRVRRHSKAPPYHLTPEMWSALLDNLSRNGVKHVGGLHIEGRGEPLMNPWLAEIVSRFKARYPAACTAVTTNANFGFDERLLLSGLEALRFSVDGAFPESYAAYRKDGTLERALRFMRDAADAKRRLGLPIRLEWKYILFEWNDGDEELARALGIAEELGIELSFCLTPHAGKSLRYDHATLQHALRERFSGATSLPSRHILMPER